MRKLTLMDTFAFRRADAVEEARKSLGAARICLVTFAAGALYEMGQKSQISSASEEFDVIFKWSKSSLRQTAFYIRNKSMLDLDRGAGYWLWKPFIIEQALSMMKDGDFIFYCDNGPAATRSFEHSVLPLCAWLSEGERRIAATHLVGYKNYAWTKRDCFVLMDCDSPFYWEVDQIQASYVGIQINQNTRKLVKEWLEFCQDPRVLSDETNTCELPNLNGFIEHRHDQSVLTNLVFKNEFEFPSDNIHHFFNKNINRLLSRSVEMSASALRCKERRPVPNAQATQISTSFWSHGPDEAAFALRYDETILYAFHTDFAQNPWWMARFDDCRLSEIQIRNRRDSNQNRACTLIIEIEVVEDSWLEIYDARFARWNTIDPIIVELNGIRGCGVKVSLREHNFLHLHSVLIYALNDTED